MVRYQEMDIRRAKLAADIVGFALRHSVHPIFEDERGSVETCFARQVAMYLTHVGSEMSLARVGIAFGRDRSTVGHACHIIEDRRDEPLFDAWMDQLEQVMCQALTVEPQADSEAEVEAEDTRALL